MGRNIIQHNGVCANRTVITDRQGLMLAQNLRASPDGYIASHDDANGRTIRRIMTTT
jgi:hypothetical protein